MSYTMFSTFACYSKSAGDVLPTPFLPRTDSPTFRVSSPVTSYRLLLSLPSLTKAFQRRQKQASTCPCPISWESGVSLLSFCSLLNKGDDFVTQQGSLYYGTGMNVGQRWSDITSLDRTTPLPIQMILEGIPIGVAGSNSYNGFLFPVNKRDRLFLLWLPTAEAHVYLVYKCDKQCKL